MILTENERLEAFSRLVQQLAEVYGLEPTFSGQRINLRFDTSPPDLRFELRSTTHDAIYRTYWPHNQLSERPINISINGHEQDTDNFAQQLADLIAAKLSSESTSIYSLTQAALAAIYRQRALDGHTKPMEDQPCG